MKVVQCWDDGPATDVRLVELLRRHGIPATFNLCPGLMKRARTPMRKMGMTEGPGCWHRGFYFGRIGLDEVRDVYEGFQVASHCWNHEEAGMIPDGDFVMAAVDARHFLEDEFQQACPGFAWPCNRHTPETVTLLRHCGFAYGRTTENGEDVTACEDPLLLKPSCHFQAPDFWERYERAKQTGVFYFWGHSWQMLDYDDESRWQALDEILQRISEDPEAEWANVIDIVPLCHRQRGK